MFSTAGYRKNLKRTLLPALLFPTEPVDRDQGDYIEDQSANPPIHLTEQRTYTTLRPAQSQSPRCRLKKAKLAFNTVQNYF